MKIMIVGGAVRNLILGLPPCDIDYLVQGATEEHFLSCFPDARQVGKSFPVFLVDGEEYAFARTERKVSPGHGGFETSTSADITVEQDLQRRDLTVNAMALCPESGNVLALPTSMKDIAKKVLRHTGPAFRDDPLRVLRVARFAAQLDGFTVAPETMDEMRSMAGEMEELPAERVQGELTKALAAKNPSRFFEVLRDCDCLGYWFPEVKALIGVPAGPQQGKHEGEADTFEHTMRVVAKIPPDPCLRFAGLCHDLGKAVSPSPPNHVGHDAAGGSLVAKMCARLKVPAKWRDSAVLFCAEHIRMHRILEMRSGKAVSLITLASKGMHYGLEGFLACSVGDGMPDNESRHILALGSKIMAIKLPAEYVGRGVACKDIMRQLRCREWHNNEC